MSKEDVSDYPARLSKRQIAEARKKRQKREQEEAQESTSGRYKITINGEVTKQ